MIRLVIDTNVFISAAIKSQSPPFLVVRWCQQHGVLLKSNATERELLDVLQRPSIVALTSPPLRDGLREMLGSAECIAIESTFALCRDAKDNKFLDLAVNGRADVLITGDNDLLALNAIERIPIIKPAQFLQAVLF